MRIKLGVAKAEDGRNLVGDGNMSGAREKYGRVESCSGI